MKRTPDRGLLSEIAEDAFSPNPEMAMSTLCYWRVNVCVCDWEGRRPRTRRNNKKKLLVVVAVRKEPHPRSLASVTPSDS